MHERANGNRRAGYQRISASNQAEARRVEQPRCGLSNLWVNVEMRPVGQWAANVHYLQCQGMLARAELPSGCASPAL